MSFDVVDEESAAAGAPSPDADAAVADLFSTVLKWDHAALVARGGAAEVEGSDDPRERLQLKSLPLTFKDAKVSGLFGRGEGNDGGKRPQLEFEFFHLSTQKTPTSQKNKNKKPSTTKNRNTSPPSSL